MSVTIVNEIPTYNFIDNPLWVVMESSLYTGSEPPYEPVVENLRGYIDVYKKSEDFSENIFLGRVTGNFNHNTKQCYLNIAPVFDRFVEPPDPATILNDGGDVAIATVRNSWDLLVFEYGLQYALPPFVEAPTLYDSGSTPPVVIKGGAPLNAVKDLSLSGAFPVTQLMHQAAATEYHHPADKLLARHTTKEQPNWMYIYIPDTGTISLDLYIKAFYKNGSTAIFDKKINFEAWQGMNYLPCGWNQLDLDALVTNPDDVVRFEVQLATKSPMVPGTLIFDYILHPCQPQERYLLMETALGGLETIPFWGKTDYGIDGSRETTRLSVTPEMDAKTGTYASVNQLANRRFKARTAYLTENYIDMITQLICGELWEVDVKGERFLKVAADQSSFRRVKKDDDQLFALEFDYRYAWDDPHLLKI